MIEEQDVEPTPRLTWWEAMRYNAQPRLWAVRHWMATRLCELRFCPSCSGYFHEAGMVLPGKCETCYARDYGLSIVYNPTKGRVPSPNANKG